MLKLFVLMLIAFQAQSMNVIPLTLNQDETSMQLNLYSKQMDFRVGGKPRTTGVYKQVHEDCETVQPTPSENSYEKSISSPIGVPAKSKASFGHVHRKELSSKLLDTAIFIIGVDSQSLQWLEKHQEELKAMQAIGFITNVNDFSSIVALQETFQLPLLPVSVDPLLDYIGEKHYPLILAKGVVWQ